MSTTTESTVRVEPGVSSRLLDILEHSLGDTSHYRNYYATAPDCGGYDDIQKLVGMGLMVKGCSMPVEIGGMEYYHVTDAGKALAFK